MNKKCISLIALFFAVLFVFAACAKGGSKYGAVIVDDEGFTHIVATDKDGSTVTNRNGNLKEIITNNKNGKPMTVPGGSVVDESGNVSEYEGGYYASQDLTFPPLIISGDKAETPDLIMYTPKGWEQTGKGHIIFTHKETGATLQAYEAQEFRSIEKEVSEVEAQQDLIKAEYKYDKENISLCGVDAVRCHYDFGELQIFNYYLVMGGDLYSFGCNVKTEFVDKVDFESIIETAQFKFIEAVEITEGND